MWTVLVRWVFKTVVGRWVTGILIATLLSGAAWKWHAFKEDLIHKGQQVCVQEINKQTVLDLEAALAAERSAFADLTAKLAAAAAVNEQAKERRRDLEDKVTDLERAMAEQAETDDEYKEWSDTPLPAGVGERLRDQAAASDPGSVREDSN